MESHFALFFSLAIVASVLKIRLGIQSIPTAPKAARSSGSRTWPPVSLSIQSARRTIHNLPPKHQDFL